MIFHHPKHYKYIFFVKLFYAKHTEPLDTVLAAQNRYIDKSQTNIKLTILTDLVKHNLQLSNNTSSNNGWN